MEQSGLGMSLPDGWLGVKGIVTPAVAQLRGMNNVTHPVINQRILARGGGR